MKKILLTLTFLFLVNPAFAEIELFFPQIVNGAGMSTEISLYLVKETSTDRTITVTAFRQDGSNWDLDFSTSRGGSCSSPCQITMTEKFESIVLTTNGVPQDLRIGWIKAIVDDEGIQGTALYFIRSSTGELLDTVAVPDAYPVQFTNRLSIPAQISGNRDTAIAICNNWPHDPGTAKIILKDSTSVQEFEFEIPGNGQKALFLSEITGLKEFNGLALITQSESSNAWLYGMALGFVEGKLGFLPTAWN